MLYSYKSDELIQDVVLECLCPLIEDLEDEYIYLRRNQALYIYAPSYIAREIVGRVLEEFCDNDICIDAECDVELLQKKDEDILITIPSDGAIYIEEARGIEGNFKNSEGTSILNYVYDCYTRQEIENLGKYEKSILIFGLEDESVCIEMNEDTNDNKPELTATVDKDGYEIKIKCNLDAEDALKVIENMEKRMERVNNIFKEMNEFRKIFGW